MVENSRRLPRIAGSRRERRVDQRRERILDAAAKIFREVGYERATLEAIGDAVGLSKASLYYYVRGKEELLARLLASVIEEIARQAARDLPVRPSGEERLRRFLAAHVDVVCRSPIGLLLARHQDVLLGEAHSRALREVRRRHERHLESILEDGVRSGEFHPLDARTVAYLILGALNAVPRWQSRAPSPPPETISGVLFAMVVGGIRATDAAARRQRGRVRPSHERIAHAK